MGHVAVGRRWERVAMDLLDMSITSAKGNRHVLVMVDCFSRWTEACPPFRHAECDSLGPGKGVINWTLSGLGPIS